MEYPALYRDGYEAMRTMCDNSVFNYADLAMHLVEEGYWPAELSRESAAARFRACLNPDKDQYFKRSEMVALMRITGRVDPVYHECDELGLERPRRIASTAHLQDQITSISQAVQGIVATLDALQVDVTAQADEDMGRQQPMPSDCARQPPSVTQIRYSRRGHESKG